MELKAKFTLVEKCLESMHQFIIHELFENPSFIVIQSYDWQ